MVLLDISYKEAYAFIEPLFIFVIGVVAYSVFVFKFYKFISRKDIFNLNLTQYNKASVNFIFKFLNIVLYIVEYVLILPIFTFFWFITIAVLLSFFTSNPDAENLLLVSVALVGSVRVAAYYDEMLSTDLAKMIPFALLGIFLIDINLFSFTNSLSVMLEIPEHSKTIIYYLAFIVLLELILRVYHSISTSLGLNDSIKK